ncbi:hypothetical protein SRCM101266_03433 [Bacillus amyloliquefaciens]|uniref:hypothetical protein n=1 Tax=Bacillus amyloliquefaciens TaxID=1390 RepID=UPI0007F04879|nr:hypothetical protein [Bacillus amyloliquefaciens]OBR26137.1 hypothetical protein SRCM101266_03433 [Bacillus amyloliquefaciens]
MYKDIAINWDVFQYKFTEKTRDVFEYLAYILFCHEFKIETGIFRYFNQPYVETLPVTTEEGCIGFQAKYYDAGTSIADKKTELKNAIKGAKTKYPEIDRFIIYTNKELSASSKKDTVKPEYQTEIEEYGLERDILVEWRVKSNFEIMLMRPELELIRDYFFNPDSGIKGYLAQVKLHSQSKLENIKSTIRYRDQIIKINKNNDFDIHSFYESEIPCLIIYGEGGSGKSGFAKDLLENENRANIAFKATDFDVTTFAEFSRRFGEYTFEDYLKLFQDDENKVCLIDSTEKVLVMNNRDIFNEFVNLSIKYGWKIIFTVRTVHKDNFINTFLNGVRYQELKIETLSKQELQYLLKDSDFPLPKEESYINQICNLFYLNLYIEIACESDSDILTIEQFIESIWTYKIKNTNHYRELDIRREKTICNIVLSCANKGVYYYEYQLYDDSEAIAALREDEIIFYDEVMRGYSLSHDIYEEIVLKHIFENLYIKKEDCKSFFEEIGDSLVVRKNLRLWLKDKLVQKTEGIKDFIIEVFYTSKISSIWQDEILITLMSIEDNQISINFIKSMLTRDEYKLLFRAIFLLNTTCRIINNDFWNKILTSEEQKSANLYRSTKPTGAGWGYIFNFIYENLTAIEWKPQNIMLVIECLYSWTSHNVKGIETKHACLIALYLYNKVKADKSLIYKLNDKKIEKINNVILSSAWEIDSELSIIVEEVTTDTDFNHLHKYYDLCVQGLTNVYNCGNLVDSNPKLVFDLANKYWFFKDSMFYSPREIEDAFKLNDSTSHDYYPSSAFQTPIFRLLQSSPWETIDFIIELFNKITIDYSNSELVEKYDELLTIKINLSNGKEIEQVASERLWLMHRGTYPAPNLLESILMALERWLLLVLEEIPGVIEKICIKLLSSQSAALTSVVVSLVEAYPQKLFNIACILISSKEVFILDNIRAVKEFGSNFLKGVVPANKLYEDERIRTNNQAFRKKRLEDVILEYQLNLEKLPIEVLENRNKILYSQLDKVFEKIEQFEEEYQFVYYRMDIRKLKLDTDNFFEKDGHTYASLVTELPASLVEIHNKTEEKNRKIFNRNDLYMWSIARFEHKRDSEKYIDYENNPLKALGEAREIWESENNEYFYLQKYAPIYVFAILIRDYKELISEDDCHYCKDSILNFIELNIESGNVIQTGSGFEAAIYILPLIISNEDMSDISLKKSIELLLILILDSNKLVIQTFSTKMWETNFKIASGIFCGYVELKPLYDSEVRIYNGISSIEFINKNQHVINNIIKNVYAIPNDFSHLSYNSLLNLNMLLAPTNEITVMKSIEIGKNIWEILFEKRHKRREDVVANIETEMEYIKWLAKYLMCISLEEQKKLIRAFEPFINSCESFEWLLRDIILKQDEMDKYDEFWNIWNNIQPIIISLCKKTEERDRTVSSREYHDDIHQIVITYLFAFHWWNDKIKSWHSLKKDDHLFFRYISYELGYKPGVLYAIGRVLNTVGYNNYLSQGIDWLYEIINNNPHLEQKKLEVNTEYYIEEYMQRYILENRLSFKKKPALRNKVIVVLNFLVNRGSTVSYMLRESIV